MLTIAGAIRAVIIAADIPGIGTGVYRDFAADPAIYPYIVVLEQISDIPQLKGDGQVLFRMQMAQVDLWQSMAAVAPTDTRPAIPAEDDTILPALVAALDSAALVPNPQLVLRCRVADVQRVPDPVDKVIHQALTLHISHN